MIFNLTAPLRFLCAFERNKPFWLLFGIGIYFIAPGHVMAQNEAFHGGDGDGYSTAELISSSMHFSLGGNGAGYDMDELNNSNFLVSIGGYGTGYHQSGLTNDQILLSKGGNGDGYDIDEYIKIYWTGNIGTAWLNANNWSSLTVPKNADEIVVPAGCPNYPLLGAQLLSIGNPTIQSGFRCAEIWVQEDASFSGKLNTTLANHSLLLIDGTFIWKNPTTSSFLVKSGGKVEIRNGGILQTDF